MDGAWRVLDLSGFEGTLESDRGGITVHPESGDAVHVPVADLAIVLVGMGTKLSASVMHRHMYSGCSTAVLVIGGVSLKVVLIAGLEHGRVAARHRAQAAMTLPRKKNAWARLVRAKITGQAAVLENLKIPGSGQLLALADKVRSGDPANVEAKQLGCTGLKL